MYQVLDGIDPVTFDHSAGFARAQCVVFDGLPHTRFVFRNNLCGPTTCGVFGSGQGEGTHALTVYAPSGTFTNSAVVGADAQRYPTGNVFPPTIAGVALAATMKPVRIPDHSGWAAGPAQLGYGDADERTVVESGSGPDGRHITTYFRHAWTVSDPQLHASLALRLLRDDGAVACLNRVEVGRLGMIAVQVRTPAAECHKEESLLIANRASHRDLGP